MTEPAIDLSTAETQEAQPQEPPKEADVIDIEKRRQQQVQDETEEASAKKKDQTQADAIQKKLQETELFPQAAKDKYATEYLDYNQERLSQTLENLIKEYKACKKPEDRWEVSAGFETTVEYCINQGKSTAEKVMLSIIHGIAEGVIPKSHIQYYQKHADTFPPLNYVLSQNIDEIKKLATKFSKYDDTFQNFYWSEIINHQSVKDSVNKNAGKKLYDHDHIGAFAVAGNVETAKTIATETDELEQSIPTAQENAYTGILAMLRANKKAVKKNPNEFTDMIGFFLMFRTSMNIDMNTIPRTAKSSLGKEMTMSQIDDEIWAVLMPLEKKLFGMLRDPDMKFEDLQKYLKKKHKINVESMEAFYDGLNNIIQGIFPVKKKWSFFGRRVA